MENWEKRREGWGPDLRDSQSVLGAVEVAGHSEEGELCSHGCHVEVGHRVRERRGEERSERLLQADRRDGVPNEGGSNEHWREVGKIGAACDRKRTVDWLTVGIRQGSQLPGFPLRQMGGWGIIPGGEMV